MKRTIYILPLFVSSTLFAGVTCTGNDKAWIKESYKHGQTTRIFKYAVSQFGELTKCHGKVDEVYNDEEMGTMTYVFKNATLTVRSAAPEVTDVRLKSDKGFANEANALKKLKELIASIGLRIDWSKSESEKEKGRETKTFWEFEEESSNGRGVLVYQDKKLVAIGYGMAL